MSATIRAIALAAALLAGCGGADDADGRSVALGGAADPRYELAAPPGAEGTFTLAVTPRPGWRLEPTAPARLALVGNERIRFEPARQSEEDAAELTRDRLAFAVAYRAPSAGAAEAEGRLKFGVCRVVDPHCEIVRRDLQLRLSAR